MNKDTFDFIKIIGGIVVLIIFLSIYTCDNNDGSQNSNNIEQNEAVRNQGPYGTVWQVEYYLKHNYLRDPDSYEAMNWGKVEKEGNKYFVLHQFRAKNGFGGYEVAQLWFILDLKGNVIDTAETDSELMLKLL